MEWLGILRHIFERNGGSDLAGWGNVDCTDAPRIVNMAWFGVERIGILRSRLCVERHSHVARRGDLDFPYPTIICELVHCRVERVGILHHW